MADLVSHGIWTRGPDQRHPAGMSFQTFARADGVDWYAHAHVHLVDPSTLKILVRDGVVAMVERDGTMLVPPGEVFEVPAGIAVERGWLWRDGSFAPPVSPETAAPPLKRLAGFLRDNPDVAALIR